MRGDRRIGLSRGYGSNGDWMSDKGSKKKISFHTEKHAGEYLFNRGGLNESKYMDMRTRITGEDTMKALIFYGILKEGLKCDAAGKIKDMLERLLIARGGKGREEAVEILKQNFPRIREVERGYDKN